MPDRRIAVPIALAALVVSAVAAISPTSTAAPPGPKAVAIHLAAGDSALLRLAVPNRAMIDTLVAQGADLTAARADGSGYLVDGVFTGAELADLQRQGAMVTQVIERPGEGQANYQASVRTEQARVATGLAPNAAADTLHFLQAYWWTSGGQTFVGTQVATTAADNPDVQITVTWRTADGTTGSYQLQRFVDDNEYQYHFANP